MKLNKIIDKLNRQDYSWNQPPNMNDDIYRCAILGDAESIQPNCLYIGTYEQSLIAKFAETPAFILCSNSNDAHTLSLEINKLLDDNQILVKNMYQLMEVLYTNRDIQHLIDRAHQILNNPIILVDTNYKILASCQSIVSDRPDLEEQNLLGYLSNENIEDLKQDNVYEKSREKGYPFYNKAAKAKYAWVVALVHIHGIESAQMGIMEYNQKITDNDLEFIHFLSRLISLELQKNDFYRTNHSLMHSIFLSELLDDRIRDITTIKHRVNNLNWKITQYMFIMTISEQHADIFDKKAQLISKQLHQLLPDSRWVIYDGHIVFLICLPDSQGTVFHPHGELAKYLGINNLTASVSRCFHSFLDVRKYYEESLTAYTMGQRFNPYGHLHFYTDYVCQHIGSLLSHNQKLSDFYHPVILQIREYDQKHKSNLLETLKEYLTYPDNPTLASERLFIHKNTLFYRMSKLKERFSLDLSDGEERLKIHLTLKFMELE